MNVLLRSIRSINNLVINVQLEGGGEYTAASTNTRPFELNCFVLYCIWGNKIMFKQQDQHLHVH